MSARKRTASQALLPTRASKHARMDEYSSDTRPEMRADSSQAKELVVRFSLRDSLALFFLNLVKSMCRGRAERPTYDEDSSSSSPQPLSVLPQPKQNAPLSNPPIPQFDFSPAVPSPPPLATQTQRASRPQQNSVILRHTQASTSISNSTSVPNGPLADVGGHKRVRAALRESKAQSGTGNGVSLKYRRKQHIHAHLHKEKVREELQKKLFELQQARGYSSSFEVFLGYLDYWQRLHDLQRKESQSALPPSRSRSESSLIEPASDQFFELAIRKARKTLESPKPPRPFVPNIEQLRVWKRAENERIDALLHPKQRPLPKHLPDHARAEVDDLLRKRGVISKVVKEQVTDRDFSRLQPGQWLNDELINFYGQLIMNRSLDADAGKENGKMLLNVHYFNTFFWSKLKMGYGEGRLAKWTKKLDIFSKDTVLVPINHNNSHWTAAAINFRLKRIESYDSMDLDRSEVYRRLRTYVDEEHRNKKKKPFDFSDWEDYHHTNTPQQENCYDCGVFTCQFLETLSRGEEDFNFSQRDMPYLRQRMMWEIGRARLEDVP